MDSFNQAVINSILYSLEDSTPPNEISAAPAFDAGNFVGNASMTWTVQAADEVVYSYYSLWSVMTVNFELNNTSVGGTLSNTLKIKIPGDRQAAERVSNRVHVKDNGVRVPCVASTAVGSAYIMIRKCEGGNFSASTNNTDVEGQITFFSEPA